MSTIPDLIPIMQEEYPNLYMLDEDMFKGEPALTLTDDDFMFAYWVDSGSSFMFFEEYDSGEEKTVEVEEIEDPSDFYQLFANFAGWICKNISITSQNKNTISADILKPLKKHGHKPETDWSPEDY